MLEGHAHLPFDNFTASGSLGHGHDALMRTVSEPEGNGRILGVSGSYSGPLATKVTMSGINPDISGEMIRRTLMCRLRRSEDPDDQSRINAARKRMPNLIEWTRTNRGRLLGAAERILQAPSTMSVDGYQDWACRVAGPLLASVNAAMGAEAVSEGDLIGAWLDVLEDGAGYIRKGTDKLLQNLEAQLVWHEPDTKGLSLSKPFAARTILRLCDSEVIRNACFGDEADMRSVTRWLNNQVNVPVQFDKKWLEIKSAGRIALGSDTDHKARPTWYLSRKKVN
jgi:hypothetical protein